MKVKKFISTIMLLIVAFVTSLTFAFSAVQLRCVSCNTLLVRTNLVLGMLDYTDYFGCQEIDGLKTRRDLAYVGHRLLCVENDDGPLCYSCASQIINEKAIARDTEYSITVPESVVLSKTTSDYTGTYTGTVFIAANGFIQLDQRVYFTASNPEMRRTGSTTVKGTTTATTATDWESMDVSSGDAKTEYTVSADITPGDWTGTMTFYATVSEKYDIVLGDNTTSLLTQNENIANIKFSSSAPEIATVDNTGYIQTVSAGNTTITKMVYDSTGKNLLYTSIYDITVSVKTADMVTTRLIEPLKTITDAGTTIDTIQFGQYTIPSGTTTYDVSGDGSNTIKAFVDDTALKVTNTKPSPVTFAAGNSLSFNQDSAFAKIKTIKYESVDTSKVTSANGAFRGMTMLSSITGLDNWNTSSITDIRNIFRDCSALTRLDLSKWDTSNITDVGCAFYGCTSLQSLNVNSWVTDKVTTIDCIFYNCSKLLAINVTNWNTSNVTNMNQAFSGCSALPALDISKWDTSKTTTMQYMFSNCKNLLTLNISGFDTSSVTDMLNMFYSCESLESLNLSNFNTSSVTNMQSMFAYCKSLTALDVSRFNTSMVKSMRMMFYGCNALTSLAVSNFSTSNVTDMNYMFGSCGNLVSLDVSHFDTAKVTGMNSMFSNCYKLESLDVSNFNTSKVTNMNSMFSGCWSVAALDVSNFDTSKVTDMAYMFNGCNHPPVIDVSKFDTHLVTNMKYMFSGCYEVTAFDVSNFDTSNVTDMSRMFYYCKDIADLDISNFDASKVTNYSGMFGECWTLRTLTVNETFATGNLPSPGVNNNVETGLLYVRQSDAMNLTGKSTLPITISGEASDALQAYDFTADNREVTYDFITITYGSTKYKVAKGTTLKEFLQQENITISSYFKSYRNQLILAKDPTSNASLPPNYLNYPSQMKTLNGSSIWCFQDKDGNACQYNEVLVDGGVYKSVSMKTTTAIIKTTQTGYITVTVPGGCTWVELLQWWGNKYFPGYTLYTDYIVGGTNIPSSNLSSVNKTKSYATPNAYLGKTSSSGSSTGTSTGTSSGTSTGSSSGTSTGSTVSSKAAYVLISSCYTNTFESPYDVIQSNYIYDLIQCNKLNTGVSTISKTIQYSKATIAGNMNSQPSDSSLYASMNFPFVNGMSNQQVMESYIHSTEASGTSLRPVCAGYTGHINGELKITYRLLQTSTDTEYQYYNVIDMSGKNVSASSKTSDNAKLVILTSTPSLLAKISMPDTSSSSGMTVTYGVPKNATGEDFIVLYHGLLPYAQVISNTSAIIISKGVPYTNVSSTTGFTYLASPTNSTAITGNANTVVPYLVLRNLKATDKITTNELIYLAGYQQVTSTTVTPQSLEGTDKPVAILSRSIKKPNDIVAESQATPETAKAENMATPETAMKYDERPAA